MLMRSERVVMLYGYATVVWALRMKGIQQA